MSPEQLKPCPFCGSAATLEDDRLQWVVRCTGCGTCVLGERAEEPEHDLPASYWEPFRQSAIDRWGRPASQPEPVGPTDEGEWYPGFADWLEREMPEGTVIGDPLWWASKIADYIARYGRPAVTPIPVSEAQPEPGPTDLRDETLLVEADAYFLYGEGKYTASPEEVVAFARRMLLAGQRYTHPTQQPITPGDTSSAGCCWWWDPEERHWLLVYPASLNPGDLWLPYSAIADPSAEP